MGRTEFHLRQLLSDRTAVKKIGKDFVNDYLYDIEKAGIHSYRYRTKKAGHLLEKIIRKKSEQPDQYKYINRKNYYKYMTDLIGIRVFFLYREDWIHFHNYITSVFENDRKTILRTVFWISTMTDHYYIAERPKVYRRTGDTRIYDKKLIDIKSDGIYRSCTISSSTRAITWRSREEPCLRRAGARLTTISCIRIIRMMRCFSDFSTALKPNLAGMADGMSSYFRRIKQQRQEQLEKEHAEKEARRSWRKRNRKKLEKRN